MVEDGVHRNGGLTGLPVTQNQLALAATYGNEGIHHFQTGLQGHGDRRALHDGCCGPLNRQTLRCRDRALAVQRSAQRVDDTPQQTLPHCHVHDTPRALHRVARAQLPIIAQQDHANFVLIHIKGNAGHTTLELQQLFKAHTGQA
ncbi:hypothetical protein GALL_420540 [mine drainage metagenome]|uniref:Uncharacterized protein n=1 Tax=mine drainage metagenome TaxID=410659 RepID=A0A1J5QFH7_9ZZZZ